MGVSIEFDLYTVKHKVGYLCLCLNKFLVTLSACSLVQDLCQLVPVGILMFTKFFTKSRVGRKIISYGNLGVISFKIAENPPKKTKLVRVNRRKSEVMHGEDGRHGHVVVE